jgi:hypothetical protein
MVSNRDIALEQAEIEIQEEGLYQEELEFNRNMGDQEWLLFHGFMEMVAL